MHSDADVLHVLNQRGVIGAGPVGGDLARGNARDGVEERQHCVMQPMEGRVFDLHLTTNKRPCTWGHEHGARSATDSERGRGGGCTQGPWNLRKNAQRCTSDGIRPTVFKDPSISPGTAVLAIQVSGQTERAFDLCGRHGTVSSSCKSSAAVGACGGAFCSTNLPMIHRTRNWIGQKSTKT